MPISWKVQSHTLHLRKGWVDLVHQHTWHTDACLHVVTPRPCLQWEMSQPNYWSYTSTTRKVAAVEIKGFSDQTSNLSHSYSQMSAVLKMKKLFNYNIHTTLDIVKFYSHDATFRLCCPDSLAQQCFRLASISVLHLFYFTKIDFPPQPENGCGSNR